MSFRQKHRKSYLAIFAACLYCSVCLVNGIILAEFALHPPREIFNDDVNARIFPAHYRSIVEEPVEIGAKQGAHLHATYATPALNDNGATVILLHGVGADRSSMVGIAELLLANGYRVLLPDSRAQGNSEGAFVTYGVLERDDVRRWIDWASDQSPDHCIYGLGESMGAAILLQSIAYDHRFCAAVAESSFATFRQVSNIRVGQFARTGPWLGETLARPMIDVAFLYVRIRYGVDMEAANPKQALAATCTPVLLIHGLNDSNIPASNSIALHAVVPATALWLVPGADHCGASAVAHTEFDQRVLQWFATHTKPCGD